MDRYSMNEVIQEWINKAEGDYLTATREADASPPNYDAALAVCKDMRSHLLELLTESNG